MSPRQPSPLPRVRFTPRGLQGLRELGLTRNNTIGVIASVLGTFPRYAHLYRQHRAPHRPDCIIYRHRVVDRGRQLTLFFVIDDTAWPTLLRVVDVFGTAMDTFHPW